MIHLLTAVILGVKDEGRYDMRGWVDPLRNHLSL